MSQASHGQSGTDISRVSQATKLTRWWFQFFFYVHSLPGEMIQFDSYFSNGLVQPPTSFGLPSFSFISLAAGWRKRGGTRRWSGDVSLTGRNAGSISGRKLLVGGWLFSANQLTRWWFQAFFIFNPTWGNDKYFSNGLKPPTSWGCCFFVFGSHEVTKTCRWFFVTFFIP